MRLLFPKRLCLGLCALALVSGCATTAPSPQIGAETGPAGEPVDAGLPSVELDPELLYQLLLGEIAIQRDELETAAEALATAAERSRDYRVADRATRAALSARNYPLAQETARLWAELRPGETTPLEIVVMTLVEEGRIDEAQEVATQLLPADSGDYGSEYRRLADLLSRQPNEAGALELMSRLVQLNPEDPEAYYAQGFLADRFKRPDLVIEAIDKALLLRPDWEDAALSKITHLIGHDAPKETIIAFCSQFLEQNPGAAQVRLYFARYLVDQEELELGLQQFVVLVEQNPTDADALYASGLLALQLERLDQAESYLKKNLELRPDNDQVRLYLGQLAFERERYEEAERWYRDIEGEAYYFEGQLSVGQVLAETQGVEAALGHLQALHPGNHEEFVRWVLTREALLRQDKQLARAKEILDAAVERYPEDTELIYARGLLAAQMELLDVHERDMRKLLVKDPTNAHALNALGYTLADITDRYEEAQTLIEQALSIRPEDPFILDSMGWVQYRLGNNADAILYLERALAKREDAEIAAHLGEVLWVNGDQERAREVWQRALEQNPDNDVLLNTLKKFNQ